MSVHSRRTSWAAPVAAAALAFAVLPFAGAGGASAVEAQDPARVGLYGAQDPAFDGAYRQSLSLLALQAAGVPPEDTAVAWLLDQQCDDGGWQTFRADLSQPCAEPDPVAFTGPDTNSTGAAVQALAALDQTDAVEAALEWLESIQNADGGWGTYAGGPTDSNSTAVVASAFIAAGADPWALESAEGATPFDALVSLQVGCGGAEAERGAFDFVPQEGGPIANDFATVQAALAVAGGALPVAPNPDQDDDAPELECPTEEIDREESAAAAAGYLARRLEANDGVIPSAFDAGADYGSTANAVLALVAAGHGAEASAAAVDALAADVDAYAVDPEGMDLPGSLALLALTAHAVDADATDFGGTDLIGRLQATLPTADGQAPLQDPSAAEPAAPESASAPAPSGDPSDTGPAASAEANDSEPTSGEGAAADELADTGGPSTLLLAGVGGALLLLILGGAVLFSTRRGRHQ